MQVRVHRGEGAAGREGGGASRQGAMVAPEAVAGRGVSELGRRHAGMAVQAVHAAPSRPHMRSRGSLRCCPQVQVQIQLQRQVEDNKLAQQAKPVLQNSLGLGRLFPTPLPEPALACEPLPQLQLGIPGCGSGWGSDFNQQRQQLQPSLQRRGFPVRLLEPASPCEPQPQPQLGALGFLGGGGCGAAFNQQRQQLQPSLQRLLTKPFPQSSIGLRQRQFPMRLPGPGQHVTKAHVVDMLGQARSFLQHNATHLIHDGYNVFTLPWKGDKCGQKPGDRLGLAPGAFVTVANLKEDNLLDKAKWLRLRVVRLVGSGSCGTIYEVVGSGDGKRLALKVAMPAHEMDLIAAQRGDFDDSIAGEMRAGLVAAASPAAQQHLVTMVACGLVDAMVPCMVQEFESGGTAWDIMSELVLTSYLDQNGQTCVKLMRRQIRVPLLQALEAVWQILHGLAALHAAGLLHGDVKPDNVLRAADGRMVSCPSICFHQCCSAAALLAPPGWLPAADLPPATNCPAPACVRAGAGRLRPGRRD